MTQTEQELEHALLSQLQEQGWQRLHGCNMDVLRANLKQQLEKLNGCNFSTQEFKGILNTLCKDNIFTKAKCLRDKFGYKKDDGSTVHIDLISANCEKNTYQVTSQITVSGQHTNRYDVLLLINGLPMVQIELKRYDMEITEAFKQIKRYSDNKFDAYDVFGDIFEYMQIFVISNGADTKYFANSSESSQNFQQTFFWADKDNKNITKLEPFAGIFLQRAHLTKMIMQYIVLNKTSKKIMVLRPYQYYAVEAIIKQVSSQPDKNGYIWHTTGSGKTLTSFKAAQVLTREPAIHKVLFVVDRKDLDYQTSQEFNKYSPNSIDSTDNTKKLVEQFCDPKRRLIVTTIQKLNLAITKKQYCEDMSDLRDKKMVFIFDECHRSLFGKTHQSIRKFFKNIQMFGFTGTPIFAENAVDSALKANMTTTEALFGECLHKYSILHAIRDENVLKFLVEYTNTIKPKNQIRDAAVQGINTKEAMENPARLRAIVDYIIKRHNDKTDNRNFTAIFTVSSIKSLIRYYQIFQETKKANKHDLKIGTIFSCSANEDDSSDSGSLDTDIIVDNTSNPDYRKHLQEFMEDYNKLCKTSYSIDTFYGYYQDIGKRIKNRELDILLVVNMFLTGFDSKYLSAIYVDRALKHHGLIQAYSRTNRTCGSRKRHGHVVCFRNLKAATDEAITLFSHAGAAKEVLLAPYMDHVKEFERILKEMLTLAPTAAHVDNLDESGQQEFTKQFRELLRINRVMSSFDNFDVKDQKISQEDFRNYQSKYADLYTKVKSDTAPEKESILNCVDFEIELVGHDQINVNYILKLLITAQKTIADPDVHRKKRLEILNMIASEPKLRSKKDLIEKFLNNSQQLSHVKMSDNDKKMSDDDEKMFGEFAKYWEEEKQVALEEISEKEDIELPKLQKIIHDYQFCKQEPTVDDIIDPVNERKEALNKELILLEQEEGVAGRIIKQLKDFIHKFIHYMD